MIHTLAPHDTFFSFGENVAPDCDVPVGTIQMVADAPTRCDRLMGQPATRWLCLHHNHHLDNKGKDLGPAATRGTGPKIVSSKKFSISRQTPARFELAASE